MAKEGRKLQDLHPLACEESRKPTARRTLQVVDSKTTRVHNPTNGTNGRSSPSSSTPRQSLRVFTALPNSPMTPSTSASTPSKLAAPHNDGTTNRRLQNKGKNAAPGIQKKTFKAKRSAELMSDYSNRSTHYSPIPAGRHRLAYSKRQRKTGTQSPTAVVWGRQQDAKYNPMATHRGTLQEVLIDVVLEDTEDHVDSQNNQRVAWGCVERSYCFLRQMMMNRFGRLPLEAFPSIPEVPANLNVTQRALQATLGNKNLQSAVRLPSNCDRLEWIAAGVNEIFKETQMCFTVLWDDCVCSPMTAGRVVYVWDEPEQPLLVLSARDYISRCLMWSVEKLRNNLIFPVTPDDQFPCDFIKVVKRMMQFFFRIYAHIYRHHFDHFWQHSAAAHVNCCFKHFLFFAMEFDLLTEEELAPLTNLVNVYLNKRTGYVGGWRPDRSTFSRDFDTSEKLIAALKALDVNDSDRTPQRLQ